MPCTTCGAPTELTHSDGGTTTGSFTEKYECTNGHSGRISGEASNPPHYWTRTGAVFNDY